MGMLTPAPGGRPAAAAAASWRLLGAAPSYGRLREACSSSLHHKRVAWTWLRVLCSQAQVYGLHEGQCAHKGLHCLLDTHLRAIAEANTDSTLQLVNSFKRHIVLQQLHVALGS